MNLKDYQNITLLNPLLPFSGIAELVKIVASKTIPQLSEETTKQELITHQLIAEARVQQEYAISHRILTSNEVEIEEFYDVSGKGAVGITLDETSKSVGVSGSGNKVTKRIYRFKGCLDEVDIVDQDLDDRRKNSGKG